MYAITCKSVFNTLYAGAKLNDVVTFTLRNYNYSATYKVEELLQNPAIVLR